jgi:hypothetical protein
MDRAEPVSKRIVKRYLKYLTDFDPMIKEIVVEVPKEIDQRYFLATAGMIVESFRNWRDCEDGQHQYRYDRRPHSNQLHIRPKHYQYREVAYIDDGTGRRSERRRFGQPATRAMKDIARNILNLPDSMQLEASTISTNGSILLLEITKLRK